MPAILESWPPKGKLVGEQVGQVRQGGQDCLAILLPPDQDCQDGGGSSSSSSSSKRRRSSSSSPYPKTSLLHPHDKARPWTGLVPSRSCTIAPDTHNDAAKAICTQISLPGLESRVEDVWDGANARKISNRSHLTISLNLKPSDSVDKAPQSYCPSCRTPPPLPPTPKTTSTESDGFLLPPAHITRC